MSKKQTILSVDEKIKALFKSECAKNGLDMSTVTESLWKSYILKSIEQRKERYAEYAKQTSKATIKEIENE